MECECGAKTRVVDSQQCGKAVYRKRVCTKCRDVFYTEEIRMENLEDGRYMLNKGRAMKKGEISQ